MKVETDRIEEIKRRLAINTLTVLFIPPEYYSFDVILQIKKDLIELEKLEPDLRAIGITDQFDIYAQDLASNR